MGVHAQDHPNEHAQRALCDREVDRPFQVCVVVQVGLTFGTRQVVFCSLLDYVFACNRISHSLPLILTPCAGIICVEVRGGTLLCTEYHYLLLIGRGLSGVELPCAPRPRAPGSNGRAPVIWRTGQSLRS